LKKILVLRIIPAKLRIIPAGLLLSALLLTMTACAQSDHDLLIRLMMRQPEKFRHILTSPEIYEIQIIYTQIERDSLNRPYLRDFTYNLNSQAYFCPASLAKIPIVGLSLEKLNELSSKGIDKSTRIGYGSSFACQKVLKGNDLNEKNPPSIARFIEQILLVSDNDAYSRLYEFLGQEYIHQHLESKGYRDARILRRFNECSGLQNQHTNPITFYNEKGEVLWEQSALFNQHILHSPLGKGWQQISHFDKKWNKYAEKLDFSYENFLPLREAHDMLIALLMPEALPPQKSFYITEQDQKFIRRSMGAYPHEGKLTSYKIQDGYYETYKKYLYYGRGEKPQKNIRIFNVVGWWAGYVSDCAYFVDFENKIEFFVSAVIYASKNKSTDFDYNYQVDCFPFLANLGKLIYEYEKLRPRKFSPDLKDFDLFK
jgi:Beta-lactamase enzyme family